MLVTALDDEDDQLQAACCHDGGSSASMSADHIPETDQLLQWRQAGAGLAELFGQIFLECSGPRDPEHAAHHQAMISRGRSDVRFVSMTNG